MLLPPSNHRGNEARPRETPDPRNGPGGGGPHWSKNPGSQTALCLREQAAQPAAIPGRQPPPAPRLPGTFPQRLAENHPGGQLPGEARTAEGPLSAAGWTRPAGPGSRRNPLRPPHTHPGGQLPAGGLRSRGTGPCGQGTRQAAAALPRPLAPPRPGEEGGASPAQGPPTRPSLAPHWPEGWKGEGEGRAGGRRFRWQLAPRRGGWSVPGAGPAHSANPGSLLVGGLAGRGGGAC